MLKHRKVTEQDAEILLTWKNDEEALKQSFDGKKVDLEQHKSWLKNKINDPKCLFLIFEDNSILIGTSRIDQLESENVISVNVDPDQRGKGYASQILEQISTVFLNSNPDGVINAYIKQKNISSVRAFEKAGFQLAENLQMAGVSSILMTKKNSLK